MFKNSFTTHNHPGQPTNFDELMKMDGGGPKGQLGARGVSDIGPVEVPTEWYLSREVHELEIERIWKKSWQYACLESDISEPGDTWVYDVAGISIVLVRTKSDAIKAYYNACLHRSVTLRKCAGRVNSLQCPFHGFTWSLDGDLIQIPCAEDFPDLKPEEFSLPEVKVAAWEGCVFINMDPDARSFEDFLGTLPEEFVNSPLKDRAKVVHVRKILPVNWKAAQEAFMEHWHVLITHPQNAISSSARVTKIDVFGNYSRGILPAAIPSEYMSRTPSEDEIFAFRMGRWADDEPLPPLKPGQTARQATAANGRALVRKLFGDELADRLSVCELSDTIYYSLFPNFHPFGSPLHPQLNIFTPYGDDHTRCQMDIVLFGASAQEGEAEARPPVKVIGEHEDFSIAPEMGFMAPFLNQDISNLSQLTKGMRNNQRNKVIFARNHELQIRHFYSLYQEIMGFARPTT